MGRLKQRHSTAMLALLVSLLWALCFPFIDLGLRQSTPLLFATLRAALGGVGLLAVAMITRRRLPNTPGDWARISGVALLSTTVGYGAMFSGGSLAPAGLATVLANIQPLLAAVLGVAILGEYCSRGRSAALIAAFLGVALLSGMNADAWGTGPGAMLLLMSALALACGNLLLKTIAARTDAVMVNGLQLSVGAIPLLAASRLAHEPLQVPFDPEFWLALFVLAGVTTALGSVLWQWVLARAPLNQVNAVNFLIPAYGLPVMLSNGEPVSALQWLGAGLVLISVAVMLATRNAHPPPVLPDE